jgi:hypothetical protein
MDWLSLALHDDEGMVRQASTNRALIAVKHRTDKRFSRYLKAAQSSDEFTARLSAIDDELRLLANEVAIEHSAPDPEELYTAAVKLALGFGAPTPAMQQPGGEALCPSCGAPTQPGVPCPNCAGQGQAGGMRNSLQPTAAEVPTDGYDRRTVDPDAEIGNTPAGWGGESLKGHDTSFEKMKGKSKDHPSETQNIIDNGTWRDERSDPQNDIKRKVEHKDVETPIGPEQTGDNTKTFGDSSKAGDPISREKAVLGSWHLLEG